MCAVCFMNPAYTGENETLMKQMKCRVSGHKAAVFFQQSLCVRRSSLEMSLDRGQLNPGSRVNPLVAAALQDK